MIKEEVKKLLSAGLINKVQYPTWLTNIVLVKKVNGKRMMRVDFTNLNKACLKDHYSLLSINSLVESTLGHTVVFFLDATLGYYQILMDPDDAEKSAFITDEGGFLL